MTSKPETVLERLARLEREATRAPWYKVGPLTEEEAGRAGGEPATIEHAWTDDDGAGTVDILDCPSEDDLELITEARNSLPALLAVVEAAKLRLADWDACTQPGAAGEGCGDPTDVAAIRKALAPLEKRA